MNGFLNELLRVGEAPAPLKTKRRSIKSLALVSKVGSNMYAECVTVISAKKKFADTRIRVNKKIHVCTTSS